MTTYWKCWFHHLWSKWVPIPDPVRGMTPDAQWRECRRECRRCGKRQNQSLWVL